MRNIIIKTLSKIGLIKFFNTYGIKRINQRTYKIPILGKMGIHNLSKWEPWMTTILEKIIPIDKELFIDVGANMGQTLLKIKSIAPDINYIGFEPNPACNFYTDILIKENKIVKAKVLPVGIFTHNEIYDLCLYNEDSTDGAASILDNFRPGNKIWGRKNVPIFNLKTVKKRLDLQHLSILKIDVEGVEYEVLQEFKDEIKSYKPIIVIEILPSYGTKLEDRLIRQLNIEKFISDLDYHIFKLILDKGKLVGTRKIQEIGSQSNINQCNYLFVHESKIKKLELYLL